MQRSPGIFAGGFVAICCLSLLLLYRWGGRGLCRWGEFFVKNIGTHSYAPLQFVVDIQVIKGDASKRL